MDKNTQILVDSGMPMDMAMSMPDVLKAYIIEKSGTELEYVPSFSVREASGDAPIALRAPAFKTVSGSKVYYDIYPTYESTEAIKPKGNDAFGFVVDSGMSMEPNSFSGVLYYKGPADDSWRVDGNLSPSEESIYGYSVSGKQLGTPDYALYLMGCCAFRASLDSASAAKKVNLKYAYNKSGSVSYAFGLTAGFVSITISSGSQSNILLRSQTFSLE